MRDHPADEENAAMLDRKVELGIAGKLLQHWRPIGGAGVRMA